MRRLVTVLVGIARPRAAALLCCPLRPLTLDEDKQVLINFVLLSRAHAVRCAFINL